MRAKPRTPRYNGTHPLSKGLVSAWLFTDRGGTTVRDYAGGHDGSFVVLTATDWITGESGACVQMQGVPDTTESFISVPYTAKHQFGNGTTDRAFSAFVHCRSTDLTDRGFIICNSDDITVGNDHGGLLFQHSSTSVFCGLYDEAGNVRIGKATDSAYGGDVNQWHTYGCTYDGSAASTGIMVYRDGVAVAQSQSDSGSYTAMHDDGVSPFAIGARWQLHDTNEKYSQADFSAVLLYDRVLSANEMKSLARDPYQMFRPRRMARVRVPAAGGLSIPIAAYHYNHSIGTSV